MALTGETEVTILPYTNIGGWVFDAFLKIDHNSRLEITQHPVQTGASIADHAFLQPRTLQFEIGMSDVAKDVINGQFGSSEGRGLKAYELLKNLQFARTPVQVTTRLDVFEKMLVADVHVPDDYKTLYGLRATVTMQEILVADVYTYKISAEPNKTDVTNRGDIQPQQPNESMLYKISDPKVREFFGAN